MVYYRIVKVDKYKNEEEEFIGTLFRLSNFQEEALKEILEDLRIKHSEDDWRTIDYAYEACKLFNERFTGYHMEVNKFPYERSFYINH